MAEFIKFIQTLCLLLLLLPLLLLLLGGCYAEPYSAMEMRRERLAQSEEKNRVFRICSPADRSSDVAEPTEFHHNIVLWPLCGTLPRAPHRPSVFAE